MNKTFEINKIVELALDHRWNEFKRTLDLDRLNREVKNILLIEDGGAGL